MHVINSLREYLARQPSLKIPLQPFLALRRRMLSGRRRSADEMCDWFVGKVVAGDVIVRVPTVDGDFEIDIRSHILKAVMRTGCYEPEISRLIAEHMPRDRDVVDVGANIGVFSVFMARQIAASCHVLSVEPVPSAVRHLKRNLAINGCQDRVIVEEKVAADKPGSRTIHVIPGMEEYSTLGSMVLPDTHGRATTPVLVAGETVDGLVARHGLRPGFMKIDVEGSESLVLQGADRTLRTFRPIILSELVDDMLANFDSTSAQVMQFLQERGYTVHNVYAPREPIRYPFTGEILALPDSSSQP